MKKRAAALAVAIFVIALLCGGLAAEDLTGEWKGSAKVSGIPLSFTVNFNADNTFSFSTTGLSAKGTYQTDGNTLTVSFTKLSGALSLLLQSPKSIGAVKAVFSLSGNALTISVNSHGIKTSATLTRK